MRDVPGGYVPLQLYRAQAVVRAAAAEALHAALAEGTLYDVAARHPGRRELQGRGAAYAIPLTDRLRVVVRHNRHGGLLAPLTGDRFVRPTRAPLELRTALRLREAGVATPDVVAIVRYPAGPGFERADVATAEIPGALDLSDVILQRPAMLTAASLATADLLGALARAGAHHADLNIKNVLLDAEMRAWVLDVDRVRFGVRDAAERNWARFERSALKWRDQRGAPIGGDWLAGIRARAEESARRR